MQGDKAGRALELVERAEHQLIAALTALDPGGRVAGQVGGHLAPGPVEACGQVADLRLGIERTVQGAADSQARGVPGLATQQALPRVGVADAGRDEHVVPLEPGPEGIKRRKDIGTAVGNAPSGVEGMAPPGRAHELGRRVGHAGLVPIFGTAEIVEGCNHWLGVRRRCKLGSLQQAGEQRAHSPPMWPQLLVAPVIGLGDQAVDACHGGLDVEPGDLLEQGSLPFGQRQIPVIVGHDMLADVAQHNGSGIEVAQRAQPRFAVGLLGLTEDVGSQGIEQFDRIVERGRFQSLEQGCQGGRASWFLKCCQVGGAGAARKPSQWCCRQIRSGRQGQAMAADGVDAFQMLQQFAGRSPSRRGTEIIERGERLVVGADQGHQLLLLLGGQDPGQALPKAQRGTVAHAADQALQRGYAGQQHLVRQQPSGRPVEQQTRPIIAGPAQDIEPPGQPEPRSRFLLEVAEPILLADGRGVPPSLPTVAVAFQARRLPLLELARHGRDHGRRRLGRIVEKGAKEARRPELDRKAKPVVGTPHPADQLVVGGIKVEVAGELLLVRIAGIAAVSGQLFVGQETARHSVRNSGLSQGSGRGPKIRHLHAANIPCEIAALCDKFHTPAGRLL